jgi:2-deoxy-D-gluconate 3-dehydrogenase
MYDFVDKSVLITGAESGLGQSFAARLLQLGATVTLTVRSQAGVRIRDTFEESFRGRVYVEVLDLQDLERVEALPARVVACTGTLDVVINNAGARLRKKFGSVTATEWDELAGINVRTPYFLSQSAAKVMMASDRPGAIVNIASQLGMVAARDYSLYCVTKAGLVAQTRALAVELARDRISVNAVAPGPTNTSSAGLLANDDDALDFLRRMPIGRRVEPIEVTDAVVFLASQVGGALTGHTLVVDGGWTLW